MPSSDMNPIWLSAPVMEIIRKYACPSQTNSNLVRSSFHVQSVQLSAYRIMMTYTPFIMIILKDCTN